MNRFRIGSFILVFGSAFAACGHGPHADSQAYDFSGLDLAASSFPDDFSTEPRDFAGYDLSCDPAATVQGGDPRGDWSYAGGCATADALYEIQGNCPSITLDQLTVTDPSGAGPPYGMLGLYATGNFSRSVHALLTAHATVPAACTQPFGGCAGYAAGETAQYNWLDMSCQMTSGTCSCAIRTDLSKTESGTWTTTAAGFSTSTTSEAPQSFEASSDGEVLRVRGDASSLRGNRSITYLLVH